MKSFFHGRFKHHTLSRAVGLLSVICMGLFAPHLHARTLVVEPNGSITSISAAVHAASNGDTIEVHSGTYNENLVLDRQLALVGIGKPVIRGIRESSVVTVAADHCAITGFVIEHSGETLVEENSGILLKAGNARIENNELRDVLFGIYLFHSDHNYIAGNSIQGRPLPDIGDRGSGIHVWNSSYNTLERNTIFETRDGMYLEHAYHSLIRGNKVHDLRYGLHYMYSDDNVFEENLFYNNVAGAAIMYSNRIRFQRNAFLHNRGYASYGILFQADEDCFAEGNVIADNAVGIFMEALRKSTLEHNLLAGNDVALKVFSSAAENHFEQNNIIDNLSPMELVGSRSENLWNGSSAGNYWSDYEGFDLDGDGVGDVPYRIQNIFEHLEAEMPLLRLYLFSPAAQSLALAERGFPVLQKERDTDNRPLMKPVSISGLPQDPVGHAPHRVAAIFVPMLLIFSTLTFFRLGMRR